MRAACENLYLFIDGQLDEPAAARFRAHLTSCRRCPPALEDALVLDALAEEGLVAGERLGRTVEVPVVAVEPPGGFRAAWPIPSRIYARRPAAPTGFSPRPRHPPRARLIVLATAVAAALAGLVWMILR